MPEKVFGWKGKGEIPEDTDPPAGNKTRRLGGLGGSLP